MAQTIIAPPVPHSYDQVVRLEVAIELLNAARGRLYARIYAIENDNPAEAQRLADLAGRLHKLQHCYLPTDAEAIEQLITIWSERLTQEDLFWQEWREV